MRSSLQQLEQVERALAERTVDGKLAKEVILCQSFDIGQATLWKAITNPNRIARWYAPVNGDLQMNGRFQIQDNAAGTITRCNAPHGYDTTWEFGGGISWLEVRNEAIERNQSKLTISHIAYPDSHWEQFGAGATGIGWDLSLLSLYQHLESDTNTPSELTDWGTSADSVAFMTASGKAWIATEVAAGEPTEGAMLRGERTINFYTGTDETD